MKLKLFLVLTALFPVQFFAQTIVDTIPSNDGDIVLYDDRTWEYLEDLNFDGVLNEEMYGMFCSDSTYNFIQTWNNEICYTSNKTNDPSKIKDTIWTCVLDSSYNKFVMPFDGKITSRYGYRRGRYHNGIDIDLVTGDTVYAAFDGKVRYAKYNKEGFGNLVIIRHYNGLETFYAHLSKHLVAPNTWVKAGDPIGLGGNTGHSYGSHLHFEVRFFDAPMNPEEIIDFKNKVVRDPNLFIYGALFRPGAEPSFLADSDLNIEGEAKKYHRIRSGDTLGHLARKYGTSVSAICRLNGIRPTTTLKIGRTLRVK